MSWVLYVIGLFLALISPVTVAQYADCSLSQSFEWYGGKRGCVYLSHDAPSLDAAERICNAMGWHLPSVHSEAESNWISQLIGSLGLVAFPLGLIPNRCQWYDGTAFDYKNGDGNQCENFAASLIEITSSSGQWVFSYSTIERFTCIGYGLPSPTSPIPSTSATSTPTAPPTSTSSQMSTTIPISLSNECGDCSLENVWFDIMFAVDSSQSMQQNGIEDVQATIRSALFLMGMSRPEIRAGIIIYSDVAEIAYKLDSINSEDDASAVKIPYLAQYGTNMEAAIVKSMGHFDDYPNKAKARKVIVMFSSGYREGDYLSPKGIASTFKADGGIIVTVDYSGLGTGPVPILDTISSPGYELNRTAAIVDDLQQALCDANCFCPARSSGFSSGSVMNCDGRCSPTSGCYRAVELAAAQRYSEQDCQEKGGHLVSIHNDDQQQFVTNLFAGRRQFWIGLNASSNMWTDGTTFDYPHWGADQPAAGADCVYSYQYQGFKTAWFTQDCKKGLPYVCSIRPCSAANKGCNQ